MHNGVVGVQIAKGHPVGGRGEAIAMIAKVARDGLASGRRGEAKSAMIAKSARDGLASGGRGDPGYGSVAVWRCYSLIIITP
jgi:hypothetical protein